MDTRSKIVPLGQAVASGATFVAGYFDPLTAHHIRRLEALRPPAAPLAVLLLEPPRPVLEAPARAQLLAALHFVDHVVIAPAGDWPPLAADLRAADLDTFSQLVDSVRQRHGDPACANRES